MFAGGRVSSFHLTLLARHSVRRLLQRWLEGEVICESRGSPQLTRWGATRRRHLLAASVRQLVRPVVEARWKHFMKYD
jgi:hypothetical protein